MHILVTNDDGYLAPGIQLLARYLAEIAEITVVAPDRNKSGASNSLTLLRPLRVGKAENGHFHVDGTPTDCVHLALTGLLERVPDMVVSGINSGPNLGDDVLYSGTVAAAMEGRNLGLPAMAVSLASFKPNHFESAAKAVIHLLDRLPSLGLSVVDHAATILNVNVPDLPYENIKGFQATRLGKRHKAESVIRSHDPRGAEIFWVGPVGEEADAGEGTDFYAIQNSYISVTPIHIDLTRYSAIDATRDWLNGKNDV